MVVWSGSSSFHTLNPKCRLLHGVIGFCEQYFLSLTEAFSCHFVFLLNNGTMYSLKLLYSTFLLMTEIVFSAPPSSLTEGLVTAPALVSHLDELSATLRMQWAASMQWSLHRLENTKISIALSLCSFCCLYVSLRQDIVTVPQYLCFLYLTLCLSLSSVVIVT